MTEVLIIVDLVSTHAVTVEKANFLVLFPPHVVHTLVGLHISDLGGGATFQPTAKIYTWTHQAVDII